ncbi:MAG: hypothetical protein H7210_06915, partial [Pyrinomonadaceae bacterium]|nr:hypothetical protein [Phycisphaerales bacterium]
MKSTPAVASGRETALPAHQNGSSLPAGRETTGLHPSDTFSRRHIGPRETEIAEMLSLLGCKTLEEFTGQTVPQGIRLTEPMTIQGGPQDREMGEQECLTLLRTYASQNRVNKSYIGMGYYDTITPGVILRNIMENPGWYTQYTPYQAEIAQGRLEAML